MTNIDRALRTLSRLQNAAPALAAARISEVTTLLMRLNAENEYLNARLMETLDTSTGIPLPMTARSTLEKPMRATDTSLEEMFGIDASSVGDLFAEFDAALDTTEVPAAEIEAEVAVSQHEGQSSSLDVYEDLESLLREHGITGFEEDFTRKIELTDEERSALERQFGSEDSRRSDLPSPEELNAQLNVLMKPALLAMRGEIESLVDGRLGRLTSNQADTLRTISSTAAGMLTLLDSLVLIDQLRQNTLTIQTTTFDAADLLDAAHRLVRDHAESRDHQIDIHTEQPIPKVKADYDRVLSILVDILDNAIRYTPNESTIRVSAESTGSSVLFTVADTGVGFSPEDSEHIGTPFWRALYEPLVRNHHGTGLRLFLAKQILALQGGEMFFSAEPGFGSSFSFTLPTE